MGGRGGGGAGWNAGSLLQALEALDPPAGYFQGFVMPSLGERQHLCITVLTPNHSITRAVRKFSEPEVQTTRKSPRLREMEIWSVLHAPSARS